MRERERERERESERARERENMRTCVRASLFTMSESNGTSKTAMENITWGSVDKFLCSWM